MSWSDEEDPFENGKSKKIHRKPRKLHDHADQQGLESEDDGVEYKRKRAGKRSHRQKTHKDDFWDDNRP